MKIVTVIPLKKGAYKENLTYFTALNVPNGSIVSVPLRNKKVLALTIDSRDAGEAKSDIKGMSFNLRKITEIKENSIFLKEYLSSALLASKYFVGSKSDTIASLIPSVFRENYDKIAELKKESKNEARKNQNIKSEKLIFQAPFLDRISVYKTLIRGSFAVKKSVFIVLPTLYDLKIFEESLSKGIEQFTFSIHGGQSTKKTIKKIEQILTIDHPVLILGTAPYLSIPRQDIETIILEHESSSAYKPIGRPHLDFRFFTELFAAKIGAKFITGDTLLRFETIGRAENGDLIPLHPMQYRISTDLKIETLNRNSGKESEKNPPDRIVPVIRAGKKFEVFSTIERIIWMIFSLILKFGMLQSESKEAMMESGTFFLK